MESIKFITATGNIIEYKNEFGNLHREEGPAYEHIAGKFAPNKFWFYNGKSHRIKSPADEMFSQTNPAKEKFVWWRMDIKHRLNAPAVINVDGSRKYFEFGSFIK